MFNTGATLGVAPEQCTPKSCAAGSSAVIAPELKQYTVDDETDRERVCAKR
jgi:hypothetical protein